MFVCVCVCVCAYMCICVCVFSDPGLMMYCCDFSTTAVQLVKVK